MISVYLNSNQVQLVLEKGRLDRIGACLVGWCFDADECIIFTVCNSIVLNIGVIVRSVIVP